MPAIFSHARGVVSRVDPGGGMAGGVLPFKIVLADSILGTNNANAIITQCAIVEAGNYQFMHTLGETVYAYIFGDRAGELRLSGICFASPCNNNGSGLQQIIDMYRKNRVANTGKPVQLSVGEIDYRAFMIGMSLEINDAERQLGQWSFRCHTFPGNHK